MLPELVSSDTQCADDRSCRCAATPTSSAPERGAAPPGRTRVVGGSGPGRVGRVSEIVERFREVARGLRGRRLLDAAPDAGGGDEGGREGDRGARHRRSGTCTPSGVRSRGSSRRSPSCWASRRRRCSPAGSWPSRPRCGSGATAPARCGSASPSSPTSSSTRTTGRGCCTASGSSTSSTGRDLPTVADLERLGGGLAAVLLELPLRDAGCLLPEWDDLVALTTKARELGVAVHVDGARIWESQPFYDRPLDEIAALADTRLRLVLQGSRRSRRRLPGRRRGRRRRGPAVAQADGRHAVPPHAVRRARARRTA